MPVRLAVMRREDVRAEIAAWPAQHRVRVVGVGLVELDEQVVGLHPVIVPVARVSGPSQAKCTSLLASFAASRAAIASGSRSR